MVMIRLIALDMDDTLLRPDLTISPACYSLLREAMARGIKVILASGRMYQSVQLYAEQLGLSGMPLITYNGALVRFAGYGETIFHSPLQIEPARELILSLRETGCISMLYQRRVVYGRPDEEGKDYGKGTGLNLISRKDLTRSCLAHQSPGQNPEEISKAYKEIARKYRADLFYPFWPRFLGVWRQGQ